MKRAIFGLMLAVLLTALNGGCQIPTRGASATWVQMDQDVVNAQNSLATATGEYRQTAYNNLQQAQQRRDQAIRAAQQTQPVGMWDTAVKKLANVAADELPDKVKQSETKAVLVMSAAGSRSGEGAGTLRSFQTRLFNEEAIQDNFVLLGLESADADRALAAAGAGQPFEFVDPLATGPDAAAPIKYNPASIYVLDCAFDVEKDSGSPRYICKADMKLASARTRQIVWAKPHQTEFIYHPDPRVAKWLTVDEDREMESAYQTWRQANAKDNPFVPK